MVRTHAHSVKKKGVSTSQIKFLMKNSSMKHLYSPQITIHTFSIFFDDQTSRLYRLILRRLSSSQLISPCHSLETGLIPVLHLTSAEVSLLLGRRDILSLFQMRERRELFFHFEF
jgi:hypothetical protein